MKKIIVLLLIIFEIIMVSSCSNPVKTTQADMTSENNSFDSVNSPNTDATQKNDWIYYVNESDNYTLYKIHTDGTESTKISNNKSISTSKGEGINKVYAVDGWIYLINDRHDLYKIRTDGTGEIKIVDDIKYDINISGNWIYYTTDDSNHNLYKINTDGTSKTKLNDDYTTSMHVAGDWIYYKNGSDHYSLYKIRVDGTEKTKLNNERSIYIDQYTYKTIAMDDWVYYTGINDDGTLYLSKIRTDGTEETKICDDRTEDINIIGDWIYYCKNEKNDSGIYKIHSDGSDKVKLHDGMARDLLVVGDWIYYIDYHSLCKMRTDGTEKSVVIDINTSATFAFSINITSELVSPESLPPETDAYTLPDEIDVASPSGHDDTVASPSASPIHNFNLYNGTLENYSKVNTSGALASSEIVADDISYDASKAIDSDLETSWQEAVDGYGIGEYIIVYFDKETDISLIRLRLGHIKTDTSFENNGKPSELLFEFSDGTTLQQFFPEVNKNVYLSIDAPITTSFMKITIIGVYEGKKWEDTAITELTAYYKDDSEKADVYGADELLNDLSYEQHYQLNAYFSDFSSYKFNKYSPDQKHSTEFILKLLDFAEEHSYGVARDDQIFTEPKINVSVSDACRYLNCVFYKLNITEEEFINAANYAEDSRYSENGLVYFTLRTGDALTGMAQVSSIRKNGDGTYSVTIDHYRYNADIAIGFDMNKPIEKWTPEEQSMIEKYGGATATITMVENDGKMTCHLVNYQKYDY